MGEREPFGEGAERRQPSRLLNTHPGPCELAMPFITNSGQNGPVLGVFVV